jgi:hypothetical protein
VRNASGAKGTDGPRGLDALGPPGTDPEPANARPVNDHARLRVQKIRAEVEKRSEYVGQNFAEEARRIHYAESPDRGIYGEATSDEVAELDAEGIQVFALPVLPEERN